MPQIGIDQICFANVDGIHQNNTAMVCRISVTPIAMVMAKVATENKSLFKTNK